MQHDFQVLGRGGSECGGRLAVCPYTAPKDVCESICLLYVWWTFAIDHRLFSSIGQWLRYAEIFQARGALMG